MKQKELLPKLATGEVENLIKFIRLNYQEEIDWDNDYCCASEALDSGLDIAVTTLEKGYGLIPEVDETEEEEEEDDEQAAFRDDS